MGSGSKLICSTVLSIKGSGVITAQPDVWTSCPPHFAWACRPLPLQKKKIHCCELFPSGIQFMSHVSSLLMKTCIHWNCHLVNSSLHQLWGLCQLGQTCHHTYQMRHHPIKKSWNWSIWYRFLYHLIHDTQSASTSLECAYSFSLTSSSWQSRATFHGFCLNKIHEHKGSMSTTREAKTKPWPPERLASPTVLPIA